MSTNTNVRFDRRATWWNSVIAPGITTWCPSEEQSFTGSSNLCPYCRQKVDKTHWKWWSPDDPMPGFDD